VPEPADLYVRTANYEHPLMPVRALVDELTRSRMGFAAAALDPVARVITPVSD